jgi:hypothetical protein
LGFRLFISIIIASTISLAIFRLSRSVPNVGPTSILSINLFSFVSAATPTASEFFSSMGTGLGSIIQTVFGTVWGTSGAELAIVKTLFAFLLFLFSIKTPLLKGFLFIQARIRFYL